MAYLLNSQKKGKLDLQRESRERQEEKVGERWCFQLVSEFYFFLCLLGAISLKTKIKDDFDGNK